MTRRSIIALLFAICIGKCPRMRPNIQVRPLSVLAISTPLNFTEFTVERPTRKHLKFGSITLSTDKRFLLPMEQVVLIRRLFLPSAGWRTTTFLPWLRRRSVFCECWRIAITMAGTRPRFSMWPSTEWNICVELFRDFLARIWLSLVGSWRIHSRNSSLHDSRY